MCDAISNQDTAVHGPQRRPLAALGIETVYSLSGNQIMPVYDALYDALYEKAENARNVAKYNPDVEFKGRMTMIADKETPFRLISEVMYTAGQAEYSQYKFAVLQAGE